jgi:REP element-mobilizing transposase RayT
LTSLWWIERVFGHGAQVESPVSGGHLSCDESRDRRQPIFKDGADCKRFLATLGEACLKTGWQVHAYCLMSNHFHLVVETPQANLVAGMKWFLGTDTGADTSRFHRRHKAFGHLFAGRLREETTMTLAWVAKRLNMGTKTHRAHLLYWQKRRKKKKHDTIDRFLGSLALWHITALRA